MATIDRTETTEVSAPSSPHRSVDGRGRALLLTDVEVRRRNEEALRALDEAATMGDLEEQDATLAALLVALDAEPL
jgi:hypothetical protein